MPATRLKRLKPLSLFMLLVTITTLNLYTVTGFTEDSEPLQGSIKHTQYPAKQQLAEQLLHTLQTKNNLADRIEAITVVDSQSINAATDGKQIYFYEGLWDKLKTTDEKAFVISHEMGHVYANHAYKGAGRRVGLSLLGSYLSKLIGKENTTRTILQQVTQGGLVLTDLRFSRKAEHKADQLGMTYLTTAGFNPNAAIETLEVLEASSASNTPEFLRSHPLSKNRIEALVNQQQQ